MEAEKRGTKCFNREKGCQINCKSWILFGYNEGVKDGSREFLEFIGALWSVGGHIKVQITLKIWFSISKTVKS